MGLAIVLQPVVPLSRLVEVPVIRSSLVQLWKLLAPWKVLLAIIAVSAVVILAIVSAERSSSRAVALKYSARPKTEEHYWKKMLGTNRIIRPPTVRPDKAGLPDDAFVIGIVVDGKARAYAQRSLRSLQQHVINDMVAGVPITVTYCDVTRCTQVYASRERSEPLDVSQAGFRDGEMILKIEGLYYQHSSGEPVTPGPESPRLPYALYPWTRVTWKEWKQQHPDTDIYVEQL
jgi:Protein of unknown function (DUF3179)